MICFVTIFKSKRGSVGETLTGFVKQIDSGVSPREASVFISYGKLTSVVPPEKMAEKMGHGWRGISSIFGRELPFLWL